MTYYRIELIEGLNFSALSGNPAERQKLSDALRCFADNGWITFQISEAGGALLVFMSHATA